MDAFNYLKSGSTKYDEKMEVSLVQVADDDYEGMVGVLLDNNKESDPVTISSAPAEQKSDSEAATEPEPEKKSIYD